MLHSLFSIRKAPKDFAFVGADIHAHLIPGIDDGPENVEDALYLAGALRDLGFRRLTATPHSNERYSNQRDEILAAGEQWRELVWSRYPGMPLSVASEYRLDETFPAYIADEEGLLTLGAEGRFVLVEMPFAGAPLTLANDIFTLRAKGYQIVLAHPERYLFMAEDASAYGLLREQGCLFQLNLISFSGHYGAPALRNAHFLLKRGWVDYLASDAHREQHIAALKRVAQDAQTMRLLSAAPIKNQHFL